MIIEIEITKTTAVVCFFIYLAGTAIGSFVVGFIGAWWDHR